LLEISKSLTYPLSKIFEKSFKYTQVYEYWEKLTNFLEMQFGFKNIKGVSKTSQNLSSIHYI